MQPVATAAEMRALDAATIEQIGLPGAVLMETAGRAVAAAVMRALGPATGPVVIVAGAGNNGGDGHVCARALRAAGVDATIYLVTARDRVKGDAALHLGAYERSGGVLIEVLTAEDRLELGAAIDRARVVVDAVLGTGLDRQVEGHLAAVIERIDQAPGVKIAVDVPSGLSADTGLPLPVAVRAQRTLTLGLAKLGVVGAPGFAYAGEVEVVDIGIPAGLVAAGGTRAALVEERDVRGWLPSAGALDHKGRRGHVLVVAGSPGKRGAGRLAALAALRAGAGLCTLAGPGPGELAAPDAVMTEVLDADDAVAALAAWLERGALVIGPGLGMDERARGWVEQALGGGAASAAASGQGAEGAARPAVPVVVDASGLGHLAGRLDRVAAADRPVVLTPHPGEAARLLGTRPATIEADRPAAVRELAAATRAVVVLKGARTLVCDGTLGDDFVTINPTGGPALATAGSGDVLAGVIGGLLAQGLGAATAARLGAWQHGAAGDEVAASTGDRGVIASDLPPAVAAVMRRLAARG
jgi:NAD(P)H-hydrate epimerase